MKRLWKLAHKQKPLTDFFVFDSETGKKVKRKIHWCLDGDFIFGAIYGYNYTKILFTKEAFIKELLTDRYKGKLVFAHNCEFDLSVLFDQIFDLDPEAVFNGKFIRCSNGVCIFADSHNIFIGQSVANIGEALGITKQTLGTQDYTSPYITTKDITYCVRDCEIIWRALLQTFEFAGDQKITQASLAMTHYRRFHQPFHIDYNENVEFFRASYLGGRCEAFKIGKTHSKVIDVNSMYPNAMRECVFPNPRTLKIEHHVKTIQFKEKFLKDFEGVCYCTVEHYPTKFGSLPYKSSEGKLLFPIGIFSGAWNFNELRYALELGAIQILKIDKIIYGEKMLSPFISYVDTLSVQKIKAKSDGNSFLEMLVKYYLNQLYGKFGQDIKEETIYIKDYVKQWDEIEALKEKGKFIRLVTFNKTRKDAYVITKSKKTFNASHCIVSFASYITSFARVQLLKKMVDLQHCGVVYCDTDSVFFEIDPGIVDEHHLGGWKIEDKIITEVRGLKNYKYVKGKGKEVWRVKGIPVDKGRKTKIVSLTEIFEVATVSQTGDQNFTYYNIAKTKEALRRGIQTRTIMKREKTLKGTYDKRIVKSNGETEPILI